jgi:hypothetical protein
MNQKSQMNQMKQIKVFHFKQMNKKYQITKLTEWTKGKWNFIFSQNEPNEPNDSNEPNEQNEPNEPNKSNKSNEPNKPNKSLSFQTNEQ